MLTITAAESGDGAVLPTWTHVDNVNVRTSRELWDEMRADGWNVEVCLCGFLSILLMSVFALYSFHHSITGVLFMRHGARITLLIYYFSIPISPDRPIEVSTP
jgi:hypothetical protein